MQQKTTITQKLKDSLQELLTKNQDAVKGYQQVIEHIKDRNHLDYLQRHLTTRKNYADEIKTLLIENNEYPEDDSSPASRIHRFWIGILDRIKQDDGSYLKECKLGEEASLEAYNRTVKENEPLSDPLRNMLYEHRHQIEKTIKELNRLIGMDKK